MPGIYTQIVVEQRKKIKCSENEKFIVINLMMTVTEAENNAQTHYEHMPEKIRH